MRQASFLVILLSLMVALAGPAAGQDDGNATNETAGNETADGQGSTNETAANETADNETTVEEETPAGPTSLTLEAHQDGGEYYFTLEGETAKNPVLELPANTDVTITLVGVSGVHNIQVQGFGPSDYVSPGETTTYVFTTPASGTLRYWCVPHEALGMQGTIRVMGDGGGQAPPTGAPVGESPDVSGPSVDLGALGYPQCAGFMIPASSAEGEVGGPTVEDYVQVCETGGSVQGERASSGADYVIPISFALIGLGVVAVVWVHRSYRP